jgi:hypothetical protein
MKPTTPSAEKASPIRRYGFDLVDQLAEVV